VTGLAADTVLHVKLGAAAERLRRGVRVATEASLRLGGRTEAETCGNRVSVRLVQNLPGAAVEASFAERIAPRPEFVVENPITARAWAKACLSAVASRAPASAA
jgi:hypothetical protein